MDDKKVFQDLLQAREIYLEGFITEGTADRIGKAIIVLNAKSENEPITLYINSNGGQVDAAFQIYDIISHSEAPVTGIVYRAAESMAAVVLQACATRKAFEHAVVMIHNIKVNQSIDDRDEMEKELEKNGGRARQQKMYDILASHAKQSPAFIKEECRRARKMTAQEALKFGLIDEVIEPKRR